MKRFSQAYTKLLNVLGNQSFSGDWQSFLTDKVGVRKLMTAEGPDPAHAIGLERLRERLLKEPAGKRGAAIVAAATDAKSPGSAAERAATLKLLWHFYRAQQRGSQDVWIYSPPVDYTKWVYDEISGDARAFAEKLDKFTEVYSEDERKVMCEALTHARAATQKAAHKLVAPDADTLAVMKRWFADAKTSEETLTNGAKSLLAGFKKIAAVCNSNHLIFSDEPIDRAGGGWKDYAFVDPTETLNVVYAQGAFLKAAGSTGRRWICVETIVHEISHRVAGTDDFGYDHSGLGPSADALSYSYALRNADSWGYFCVDLAGMLAESDRAKVLKSGVLLKRA